MEKIKLDGNVFLPMPITLLGVQVEGRANFMTLGWITRINAKPPMLAAGVNKAHYSVLGLKEEQPFSVNLPGADLLALTDYCGLVSGRQRDKSGLFKVFHGELGTAPMIEECPLCLECRVVQLVDLPTNLMVVGEIVAAYCEERFLTQGQPDLAKIRPLLLSMPDNTYWTLGSSAGRAWSAGKQIKVKV